MTNLSSYQQRVYIEDTDAGGIVYHANFIKYAERARTEWLRTQGMNRTLLLEKYKVFFIVRHLKIDYLSPASMDDVLEIVTRGVELKKASVTLKQEFFSKSRPVAVMYVKLGLINNEFKPQRMPLEIQSLFQKIME